MNSRKSEVGSQKPEVNKRLIFLFRVLSTVCCLLFTVYCFAEEPPAIITSDSLEHEKEIYTAKGSVKVRQGSTTIESMEMRYDEKTSVIFATGNVRYEDAKVSLKSEKARYNLDTKTGTFYHAEISSKSDNFRVSGTEIEKKGEKEYFLTSASLTTCDASPPAWCFKGKNVDVTIGDRLKARDATFHIKEIPVLYTPYLWAPALSERKTGLLTPVIGYSKVKGFNYRQPFFWAVDENKDATFIFDWYSARGFGEGVEYRYLDMGNVEGTHWLYHIYDKNLGKDFYELRSTHEKRDSEGLSAYMNLNLLSGKSFYREYSRQRDERIKRFLESTAEASLPADNSRFYIMSQYLMDLKDETRTSTIIQRLPEFGYVVNPHRIGPVIFSLTSSASNLWREEGVFGQRIDIYPKFSHSFGDGIVISQNLGLRETLYFLHRNEDEGFRSSVQRDMFDYNITASSRIIKDYSSFTHAIEPSLGYTFIPRLKKDKSNLPLFDSTELYSRLSMLQLSILNRILDRQGEFFTLNLSGSYNSYGGDRPFSPLVIAASIVRPIQLRGDASYNTYTGRIEGINSDMAINVRRVAFSLGERYNRIEDTMFYDLGINYSHSKNLSTETRLWYDAKGGGVRDITFRMKYQKQCWGITMAVNKRPGDYNIYITFDLLGLGSLKI